MRLRTQGGTEAASAGTGELTAPPGRGAMGSPAPVQGPASDFEGDGSSGGGPSGAIFRDNKMPGCVGTAAPAARDEGEPDDPLGAGWFDAGCRRAVIAYGFARLVQRAPTEGPGEGLSPVNSAGGRGSPITTQNDPVEAYRSLFGVGSSDPSLRAAFQEQGLLLDGIPAEAQLAERRLNGEVKWKLQRYLYSVESFQIQHQRLQRLEAEVRACTPATPTFAGTQDVGTILEKQANLAGAALICGLTNIVVLTYIVVLTCGTRSPFEQYAAWGFGGGHTMGHGRGATETRRGGHLGLADTAAEINQRVTDSILRPPEAIPEGDGTMPDNTTVIHLNDDGDQHHAKYDNWPVLLVGDLEAGSAPGAARFSSPIKTRTAFRASTSSGTRSATEWGRPPTTSRSPPPSPRTGGVLSKS